MIDALLSVVEFVIKAAFSMVLAVGAVFGASALLQVFYELLFKESDGEKFYKFLCLVEFVVISILIYVIVFVYIYGERYGYYA